MNAKHRMSMVVLAMAMPGLLGCGANPGGFQPEGNLQATCVSADDCAQGLECANGLCVAPGGCSDSCVWASDGECDDGGADAPRDGCDYGTDCTDCGPRGSWTPPKPEPICRADSDCDDDDACTTDMCAAATGCVNETVVCDDGVFCNGAEVCADGLCINGELPCAGNECDEETRECFAAEVSTVDEILYASWLVVAYDSGGLFSGAGSAFAIDGNLLATNAHVVEMAAQAIRLGGSAFAYQHETSRELAATVMWIHPGYTGAFSPDVGVIEVYGTLLPVLTVASTDTLRNLRVSDDVRLSGFPGELVGGRPRATMLSGRITALRPFDQSQTTPETAMLIQHDMPTTGGTSGSPVVNSLGEVIAVHNSTAAELPGNPGNGQNNFAIRADALLQLLGWVWSGQVNPVDLSRIPSCGENEVFNPVTGVCEMVGCGTDADCDDGLLCNGQEICDIGTGACFAGEPPCTECEEGTGCVSHLTEAEAKLICRTFWWPDATEAELDVGLLIWANAASSGMTKSDAIDTAYMSCAERGVDAADEAGCKLCAVAMIDAVW